MRMQRVRRTNTIVSWVSGCLETLQVPCLRTKRLRPYLSLSHLWKLAYCHMRAQVLSSTVPAHRMCQTLSVIYTSMDAGLLPDTGSSALKYRACAQNVSDAHRMASNICCVLHALRGCRVTKLISWERPHSMFLLCFACFERMPSNKIDFMGAPTFKVSVAKWIQVSPSEFRWVQVRPSESKWDQVSPLLSLQSSYPTLVDLIGIYLLEERHRKKTNIHINIYICWEGGVGKRSQKVMQALAGRGGPLRTTPAGAPQREAPG